LANIFIRREVRISVFGRLSFLPLLHRLVEERVGERRLATFHVVPSPCPFPRYSGQGEVHPMLSKEQAKN
jgi:hypothetical protein